MATLDSVTSDICREMDGKVFPMSEYESGSTAPPFHVWCRTTTVPAFGDEFDHIGERAARDPDTGKTCYVPVDMKYQEWKEKFVDERNKSNAVQVPQIRDETIRKVNEEFSQVLHNSKSTPISDKMILYNEVTEYQLNEGMNGPFVYNPELDVIQYNPSALFYKSCDMNFVQAHELTHRMDIIEYHSWVNKKFLQAIEETRKKVYDNSDKIKEWFSEGGKYDTDIALADIFSSLSNGELNSILCGGHSPGYWLEDRTYVCMEIFADMAGIDVLEYDSKAEFYGILEELYRAYREVTG